ncbi:MAG: lysophospholipid acyltransferase family protein [Deltaproteobacteria bacterium]|nr:lysophospholipid acyltransferase family protein [Deltaproteobacteria bacterium]
MAAARYFIQYALFRAAVFAARALPRNAALRLGEKLGGLARFLLRKHAAIAADNLRQAFPEKSAAELRQTLRAVFRHLGASAMEILRVDLFKGKEDLERYFIYSGKEHLEQAYALGKGVFLLSGHVGFWEGGSFFLPTLGFPTDCVAKRIKNPYIDRYFGKLRGACGVQVLDSKKGARRILRSLAENRGVGVVLDQHITRSEAVPNLFFGREVWTTPIITQIAMKQGVPIVPMYFYRTPDFRYQVVIEPVIRFENEPGRDAILRNTALLTANIEAAVRRDITQWFWVHRRWRTYDNKDA